MDETRLCKVIWTGNRKGKSQRVLNRVECQKLTSFKQVWDLSNGNLVFDIYLIKERVVTIN